MSRDAFDIAKRDIDLVDLVRAHVGMEPVKRGTTLFISCCKDGGGVGDSDPSLALYPGRNGFYCYHCGWHGSVIDFVMGWKGVATPIEALQVLDELYPDLGLLSTESRARADHRSRYIAYCKRRTADEHAALVNSPQIVELLMKKRGISTDAIEQFQLGANAKGEYPRLSIPQRDQRGEVVAFITRQLHPKDPRARYLAKNVSLHPDTGKVVYNGDVPPNAIEVFRKGAFLYNLDQVGIGVTDAGGPLSREIVLVEGHLDVVAAWELDIDNAAAYGTKVVSDDQVSLLSPFSRVVLIPDLDAFPEVIRNVEAIRAQFPDVTIGIVDLSVVFPDEEGRIHVKDVGDALKRSRADGTLMTLRDAVRSAPSVESWLYRREIEPYLGDQTIAYTQAQRLLKVATAPMGRAWLITQLAHDLGVDPQVLVAL